MEGEVQGQNDPTDEINEEPDLEKGPPQRILNAWLDKAGEAIESSGSTRSEHKNCVSWCPNCVCCYTIGRRIRDWRASISRRIGYWKADVSQLHSPIKVPVQNLESGFVANARISAQTGLVERWLTDEDNNIRRIAIIGMGGVGKTFMLRVIHDSEKVKSSFDLIIWVTVSRNWNMSNMQNRVAEQLNIKQFPDQSNRQARKDMLQSYLKSRKYLILLDDMWAGTWKRDDLQELGVSLDDTGSKFVLTTRDKEVCRIMNVQQTITVELLPEEEGWQLFRGRVFGSRDVDPQSEEVARKIAKECKGLPLAIEVVAAGMRRHTELDEWEFALNEMEKVPERFYDLHAEMNVDLFGRLRWSYDDLPDRLKLCFLYFAAYPEDRIIYCEQVIDMWISEGLVEESVDSYLHEIGNSYIKQLEGRCLIEVVSHGSGGRISSVKIPNILRVMAIRIAEKEQRCFFKAGQSLKKFNSEEVVSKDFAKLSLMSNNLQTLQTTFTRSSLSVLLLRENPSIEEVPRNFLKLPSLRVLDLSETGITSLPSIIGNLKYLACLNLQGCKGIYELPGEIADLKELQFLNVSFCGQLRCLPQRIGELKRLRALDVRECRQLSHLPRGISELDALERLRTMGSSIRLDLEGVNDLQHLRRLRVLWVRIKSPVKEGVMGNWPNMRDLLLDFEDEGSVDQDYLPQDRQRMQDLESLSLWNCNVVQVSSCVASFGKLQCLCLIGCNQMKDLHLKLSCLRVLCIDKCDKLEILGMDLPKLQELTLLNLKSLERVGAVAAAASGSGGLGEGITRLIPMVKFLEVWGCSKLKTLQGIWDKLNCLEEIRGSREWWDAMEWKDPDIKASLESKFKVSVFELREKLVLACN